MNGLTLAAITVAVLIAALVRLYYSPKGNDQ